VLLILNDCDCVKVIADALVTDADGAVTEADTLAGVEIES